MAIRRGPHHSKNYTTIDNPVLRDKRLSLRARGLLVLILSYPPNYKTSADRIAQDTPEGRDAVRNAMNELKDAGYVRTVVRRGSSGKLATELVVYERPRKKKTQPQPTPENPSSVRPAVS